MTPKERLACVLAKLAARGVKDIRFTWSDNVDELTLDQIRTDAAIALEAYLEGRCTPAEKFGDDSRLAYDESVKGLTTPL